MSGWTIYWITRLDDVRSFLEIAGCLAVVLGSLIIVIGVPFCRDFYDDEKLGRKVVRVALRCVVAGAVSCFAAVFIPSTRGLAAILVIPPIVNAAAESDLPAEIETLAREWIQELRPAGDSK